MMRSMRLFKRRGWWHVEFYRGKSKSLKTRDEGDAQALFREIEEDWLRERFIDLEKLKSCTIAELSDLFTGDEDRASLSIWTIKKDKLSLKQFGEIIGTNTQIRTVRESHFKTFKKVCRARGVSSQGINSYLRHIKSAFRWAVDEKLLSKVPRIKMEKIPDTLPRYLTTDKVDKILDHIKEVDHSFYRYTAFLFWTGARRREGLRVRGEDFIGEDVKLIGKGRKERLVYVLPKLRKIIEPIPDIGYLFPQHHPDTLSKWFHKYALEVGINTRLHDLRHSFATYFLSKGGTLKTLQRILGHAAISTTQIYGRVVDEMVKKEMQNL